MDGIRFFLSDNGMPFPFVKSNCYLTSINHRATESTEDDEVLGNIMSMT